jgi:hypothetical protein
MFHHGTNVVHVFRDSENPIEMELRVRIDHMKDNYYHVYNYVQDFPCYLIYELN